MEIRIHQTLIASHANGPGTRNVVWVQGCTLNCPDCFNPQTHDPSGGMTLSANELCEILLADNAPCDGITVSGGEPFQQPEALLEFLQTLHERSSLPVLVFSGYTFSQLKSNSIYSSCFPYIDALICGPFRRDKPPAYDRFCSSENQELILLSDRYTIADFSDLPLSEMIIDEEGNTIISGIYS